MYEENSIKSECHFNLRGKIKPHALGIPSGIWDLARSLGLAICWHTLERLLVALQNVPRFVQEASYSSTRTVRGIDSEQSPCCQIASRRNINNPNCPRVRDLDVDEYPLSWKSRPFHLSSARRAPSNLCNRAMEINFLKNADRSSRYQVTKWHWYNCLGARICRNDNDCWILHREHSIFKLVVVFGHTNQGRDSHRFIDWQHMPPLTFGEMPQVSRGGCLISE